MNHVPSDQSFYIESEDEDDRKDYVEEDGGSHSDSSDDVYDENQAHIKPSSYTTAWPQSYRFGFSPFPLFIVVVKWICFISANITPFLDLICYVLRVGFVCSW